MKIMWIGGNQPRHLYYINEICKQFKVDGGIMQERGGGIPTMPDGLGKLDQNNWTKHFWDRLHTEEKFFGDQKPPDIPLLKVDKQTLNSESSVDFVRRINPDIVLVFGTGMIREPLFSSLPKDTINLHLGLSPRYRGAATLFWPFYFLEPQFAGTTFHRIVNTPDGGDIIHQTIPEMKKDDGIHDLSCRAVQASASEATRLLKLYPEWKFKSQKPETGKNFLESDFKPQHLRLIYQVFNNDIVHEYMEGHLEGRTPRLERQF
jgi:hypothetical protein